MISSWTFCYSNFNNNTYLKGLGSSKLPALIALRRYDQQTLDVEAESSLATLAHSCPFSFSFISTLLLDCHILLNDYQKPNLVFCKKSIYSGAIFIRNFLMFWHHCSGTTKKREKCLRKKFFFAELGYKNLLIEFRLKLTIESARLLTCGLTKRCSCMWGWKQ